uniref:Uncharacterized protein n=1 Tax=Kalanchoe fedtschenkoi TaxID=63787 RepID=A0A7N0V1P3_KALFE
MGRPPCCDKDGLKKGPWTPEEDQKLVEHIQIHGCGNWRTLPGRAGLERCGKSCRLRWTNYLRPDIKRGRFSVEEEEAIIHLHSILGNKWATIAARLPGRTDNEIKNYWNTHIKKRLLRMGIDPVTHRPRLDLLDLSAILDANFYNGQMAFHQPQRDALVHSELLGSQRALFQNQDFYMPNIHSTIGDEHDGFYRQHGLAIYNEAQVVGNASTCDSWRGSEMGLVGDQIPDQPIYDQNGFYGGSAQVGSGTDSSASASTSNSSNLMSHFDSYPSFNSRASNTSTVANETFDMQNLLDEFVYSCLASGSNN